jgi:phosphonatase-like hydrolase
MDESTDIRLACLDMAGTTVQDGGAVMEAFGSAMDAVGIEQGTAQRQRAVAYTLETMGQPKIEVFRTLTGDEGRARLANETFEQAYLEQIRAGGALPVEGAEEAIGELREAGVRVCLTTGFSATTRDVLLESLGWSELVDLALSPADVGRGRPYPDMILTALVRLGVDHVRQIANVGDTASDVLSGVRAGASISAGVLTGSHGEAELRAAGATHVLRSVADLPALIASR